MNLFDSTFRRVNSLIRREPGAAGVPGGLGVPGEDDARTPSSPSPARSPRRERRAVETGEPSFFYALYRCMGASAGGGTRLDVAHTDCAPELEKQLRVREFVAQKLETAQTHVGGSVGLLPALVTATRVASTPSCYYALIGAEHVLCLVSTVENLSLFLADLQRFRDRLEKAVKSGEDVAALLEQWHSLTIAYFARVVSALSAELLAVLLHAAFIGRSVRRVSSLTPSEMADSLCDDIFRFADAVRLRPLSAEDASDASEDALSVEGDEGGIRLVPDEANAYCMAWARELKAQADEDSFTLKHAVDERKMHVMNDMNVVNKLVNQAKADHYALYGCYRFLRASGNVDVLLIQLLKDADASADETTLEVLQVIFEYYKEQEAAASVV